MDGTGRFENKVAMITGASDKGIGGAIAERIVREGGQVCLPGVERPRKLLRRLNKTGEKACFLPCDVTEEQAVQEAVRTSLQKFGKIDVVVNNAGVEYLKPLVAFSDEESRHLLDVNLQGALRVSRIALPVMKAGSVIVNIASALALGGCAAFSVYSASKAGLIGLTQSLAMEVAARGIRVVAVAPGLVATAMTFRHIRGLTPAGREQLEAAHPMGTGSPHDVASSVAFLASEDARLITGITLPVGFASQFALPVDHFFQAAEAANKAA